MEEQIVMTMQQRYTLATEICDGIDNNCDENTDEGVQTSFYLDVDGDGFALDGTTPEEFCEQPEGYATEMGDCDDNDETKVLLISTTMDSVRVLS